MPRIDTIRLRCQDPEAQKQFYCDVLGMSLRDDGAAAYSLLEAGLVFEPATKPYQPSAGDTYWKIALAVPNIELAYDQLTSRGIAIRGPHQFQDVGYLAHIQDPEGFSIELIDHWFKGNRPAADHDKTRLGGGACLNLLTLRAHDIGPLRDECLAWGMTPLSVQQVADRGFTLHFYAFTDETPPNSDDLEAVENRTWVYQRPYTVLEIQEVHGATPMSLTPTPAAGYAGAQVADAAFPIQSDALLIRG